MNIIEDLKARGLFNQVTDEEGLEKHLNDKTVSLYCGFDPTGDSLHIGHLLPVIILKRFQKAGHRPIALVGGGTGMIGDPSGRNEERQLNDASVVEHYSNRLKEQLSHLIDFTDDHKGAIAVNNLDWLNDMTVIELLRDVGKHFSVNYMLAKDSVESRIENGISFTEFSYMLLQSLDFLKLNQNQDCTLQIGGSDQWGNITAGLELIRRTSEEGEEVKAYGLTFPLITKADGSKFGKTAGGAIWLDPDKTSPYEFYQFWVNADDRDVIKFLKYFTFLSLDEIAELEKEVEEQPEQRTAQRRLAEEMTELVHGDEALDQAIRISNALFKGDIKALNKDEIEAGFKDVPSHALEESEKGLIDLLVEANISSSKRQAREDIKNGAIYINGEREQDMKYVVDDQDKIDGAFTVIRRGKKKYFLIRHQ
ncbi:tyrosine--tRNA ligase [Tenuibacillus multivorans]|uniref:Tyrosine--tRNA ligase n=1 Tax=Tenuibacillus multivorans TaxID=237069 RepID=A0A1H0EG10_9BACI|nr:tyrosine--tRNA ligase [Tenuibacillus multivorans]GEL77175.1 tyrosine--tRNA ligase 1 [Tenuibacillus multivorans]SDN81260.1 tyrosyl-tRNA synthetase [Tenuibacillus multivorans]